MLIKQTKYGKKFKSSKSELQILSELLPLQGGKKKSGPGQVVVRAVCCSDDSEEEGGETVITQHWR